MYPTHFVAAFHRLLEADYPTGCTPEMVASSEPLKSALAAADAAKAGPQRDATVFAEGARERGDHLVVLRAAMRNSIVAFATCLFSPIGTIAIKLPLPS